MLFLVFVVVILMKEGFCDPDYYMLDASEVSDEDVRVPQRDFKVYWNVPTVQCKAKNVVFDNLSQFGIIQNEFDRFRQGDKMTILYDPGFFPAMFYSSPKVYRYRNGGVPQEGSIQKHLDALKISVEEAIPNKEYNGIAVIDFESWKPIFNQNYGILKPYIDVSYDIERKEHWWWPQSWIITTARERFERSARIFMESTLRFAKKMRPNATWGYYSYPYCYHKAVDYKCAHKTMEENDVDAVAQDMASFYDEAWYEYGTNLAVDTGGDVDRLHWLWNESTGIFPSVYTNTDDTKVQLEQTARAAVAEAVRVSHGAVILPYISYSHRDSSFYSESDLEVLLNTIFNSKANGVIIWGKSKDVNTKNKCQQLLDYMTNKFGPLIAQFTRGERRRVETTPNTIVEISTQTSENLITTEKVTLVMNPTTEVHNNAFSVPSHQFITTQIMENVSDFLETANRAKQDSLSGEIVLNSIIQFFDMADANSSFIEPTEQGDFTQNPDDTPGFTQNEEQQIKPETIVQIDNSEPSLSFKRKDIPHPITLPNATSIYINWKKSNLSTPITNTTIKTETEATTVYNKIKAITIGKTISSVTNVNDGTTTDETTVQDMLPDRSNIIPDILETLNKLTNRLDEKNTNDLSSTDKNTNDNEQLADANQILHDLADNKHSETNKQNYETIVDNNKPIYSRHFYDFANLEETLEAKESKSNNKDGQELDDDMILEAVAGILNSNDRSGITSS